MSRTRCVGLLGQAVTPSAPAGVIAALEAIEPSRELTVDARGRGPSPQSVRKPSGPEGTTDALSENAFAAAGIMHADCGIGKVRAVPADMIGPPNGPAALRVSAIRQGETAKKSIEPGPGGAK